MIALFPRFHTFWGENSSFPFPLGKIVGSISLVFCLQMCHGLCSGHVKKFSKSRLIQLTFLEGILSMAGAEDFVKHLPLNIAFFVNTFSQKYQDLAHRIYYLDLKDTRFFIFSLIL